MLSWCGLLLALRTCLILCRWLVKAPDQPDYRALVIYGGPGLGKSTIAASLVLKSASRTQDVQETGSAVAGHFFCKHNDVK